MLLTILSSLSQEESRSISENVKWGQRKRMADGKFSMPYSKFLGYEKGEDLPELIAEFVEALWAGLVDSMTVHSKDRIIWKLTCGDGVSLGEMES